MADRFIIDPNLVSQSEIKQAEQDYVASKGDTGWEDYFDGGVGETIIELIAGLGAFVKVQVVANRRETYLLSAQAYASVVAGANSLGYSAFRGQNQRLLLNITPDESTSLGLWESVGTAQDQDVLLAAPANLVNGVPQTITVIIGNVVEFPRAYFTADLTLMPYRREKISEDIRLYLDGDEVPVSSSIIDLQADKYVAISNSYGGIDVFYLQTGDYQYDVGMELSLHYVELFDTTKFKFSRDLNFIYGTVNTIHTAQRFRSKESISSIKINAPLHHEAQRLIRGRLDYLKLFKELTPGLVSTNGVDPNPFEAILTYVKEDGDGDVVNLSSGEKTTAIATLDKFRPFGVQPPTIENSIRYTLNLTVTITMKSGVTDSSSAVANAETVLRSFEKTLGLLVDFYEIEDQIEDHKDVKVARITFKTFPWARDAAILTGTVVVPTDGIPDLLFFATTGGATQAEEPVWPDDVGAIIEDNQVTWKTLEKEPKSLQGEWNWYFIISETFVIVTT